MGGDRGSTWREGPRGFAGGDDPYVCNGLCELDSCACGLPSVAGDDPVRRRGRQRPVAGGGAWAGGRRRGVVASPVGWTKLAGPTGLIRCPRRIAVSVSVTGDRSARRRDTVPPTRGGEREAVAVASQIRTGSALPGRAPAQVRRWGGRGGVCVSAIREEGWVWVRAAGMKSLSVIKKSREVTSRKRETCMFHMFLSSLSRGSTCQSKWVRSFFGDNGFPFPSLLYSI